MDLSHLLYNLNFLLGVKVAPEDMDDHKKYLVEFIAFLQNNYANTSLEEIRAAHTMAVKGELPGVDEVYATLTPNQFGKVMKAWQEYKTAQLEQVRRSQKLLPAPQKQEPSQEEFDRDMLELLKNALEATKSGQEYIDYGNILYDFLERIKMAEFSNQEKWEAVRKAQEKLMHDAQRQKTGNPLADRARIKALKDLIAGAAAPEDPKSPEVVNSWAKRILLSQLLSDITYEGADEIQRFVAQAEEKVNQINSKTNKNHERINPDHYRRSA